MSEVTFFTNCLLSKWGFGDGDMLDDLLWDHGYGEVWQQEQDTRPDSDFSFDHRVLIRVVEEHVLPAVRQHHDITTYRILTIHNPIRAEEVDGDPVAHPSDDRPLTPDHVEVPVDAILAIAAEEAQKWRGETP